MLYCHVQARSVAAARKRCRRPASVRAVLVKAGVQRQREQPALVIVEAVPAKSLEIKFRTQQRNQSHGAPADSPGRDQEDVEARRGKPLPAHQEKAYLLQLMRFHCSRQVERMEAAKLCARERLTKHLLQERLPPPSGCFSGVIVERAPDAFSVKPFSPPHVEREETTSSRSAAAPKARRVLDTLMHDEHKSAFPSPHSTRAASAAKQGDLSKPFIAAMTENHTAFCELRGHYAPLSGVETVDSEPQHADTWCSSKCVTLNRNAYSSGRVRQAAVEKPFSPAAVAQSREAVKAAEPAQTLSAAGADYSRTAAIAAAIRPAARVRRMGFASQQHQEHQGENSERTPRLPAVTKREYDAEQQQIAREARGKDLRFVMGEVVERSAESQQQRARQERKPQQQVEPHQQKEQQQEPQQSPMQTSSVGGNISTLTLVMREGPDTLTQRDRPKASAAGLTAAAAGAGKQSIDSDASCLCRAQDRCKNILEPSAAVEAPLGFPKPVHRSLLQQQLQQLYVQKRRQLDGRDLREDTEQRMRENQKRLQRTQQEVQHRASQNLEKQTTAPVAEAPAGFGRAGSMARRGHVRPEEDRASIEAEAAELLQSMQPRDIAAARQELLDRFGADRFASLQRRALRRAAAQLQDPQMRLPSQTPVSGEPASSDVGILVSEKPLLQEAATNACTQRQLPQTEVSGLFARPSFANSQCSRSQFESKNSAILPSDSRPAAVAVWEKDSSFAPHAETSLPSTMQQAYQLEPEELSPISMPSAANGSPAVSTAFVSFSLRRLGKTKLRTSSLPLSSLSSPSSPSSAAACGQASSDSGAAAATTAASGLSPPPPAGPATHSIRFDLHEAAKLRWTDPLGPEDWRNTPSDYTESATSCKRAGNVSSASRQDAETCSAECSASSAPEKMFFSSGNNCLASSANGHVRLEQLRFDFDGRLRSDLLQAEVAVKAVVAGVRAAEARRRRCSVPWKRAAHAQPLKGSEAWLTKQKALHAHIQRADREFRVASLPKEQGDAVRHLAKKDEAVASAIVRDSKGNDDLAAGVHREARDVARRQSRELAESTVAQEAEAKIKNLQQKDRSGEDTMAQESDEFNEDLSDESDPLEFHRGLHHHGAAAALPGYTLPELLHLAQSSNHAQAALALQTLDKVLRSGRILFRCPSAAEAAAFVALYVRGWAEQQRGVVEADGNEELPQKPQRRGAELHEERVRFKQEKRPGRGDSGLRQQAENLGPFESKVFDRIVFQYDAAAGVDSSALKEGASVPRVQFWPRAGYGLGLKRFYSYVARDLYLTWRLHSLLYVQAAAVYRASLSCLAASLGPPAVSGVRRVPTLRHLMSLCSKQLVEPVAHSSGKGNCSQCDCCRSSSTIIARSPCICGLHWVDDDSSTNDSSCKSCSTSSTAYKRVFSATRACGSEAAVDGSKKETLKFSKRGKSAGNGEVEDTKHVAVRGLSGFVDSAAHLPHASQQRTAGWGSELICSPLHLKKLPWLLTNELLSYQRGGKQKQQRPTLPAAQHPQRPTLEEQRAIHWKPLHRKTVARRDKLKKWKTEQEAFAEIDYVCLWGLAGLDFVTEGLMVFECCSGLADAGPSESSRVVCAAAAGGDASGGCSGVFLFWHAFTGLMSSRIAAAVTNSHQQQEQFVRDSQSTKSLQQCSVKQDYGDKKHCKNNAIAAAVAPPAFPARGLKRKDSLLSPRVDAATAAAVTGVSTSGRTMERMDSHAPLFTVLAAESGAAAAFSELAGKDAVDDKSEATGDAAEYSTESSAAAFSLYDSVGALFSSSPVEALVEHGKLLDRLALLLDIHETDEDLERRALQLLIGLSAAGTAPTLRMLSHPRLQERIRSLAEGLLLGSAARVRRLQQQTRQRNLACATFRAATRSSSVSAANVYFSAAVDLGRRQAGHRSRKGLGSGTSTSKICGNGSELAMSCSDHSKKYSSMCPSYFSQQEHPEIQEEEDVARAFFLKRTEYLLLRELFLLLRLWAEWAPTERQCSRPRNGAEAHAAAAWKDTLVGQGSACYALLLQAFTRGISLVHAAAVTAEPLTLQDGAIAMPEAAAAAEAICPASRDEDGVGGLRRTGFIRTESTDKRFGRSTAAPSEADILITAVEAARALRGLEASGALPNLFAFFYPSAVRLLHSFTKCLTELQRQLSRHQAVGEELNHSQRSMHPQKAADVYQRKACTENGALYDINLELQQQLKELQQHSFDLQVQACPIRASNAADHFSEVDHHLSLLLGPQINLEVEAADVKSSSGSSRTDCGTSSTNSARSGSGIDKEFRASTRHDVASAWIFQGFLVKEVLRWAAVAAVKAAAATDASSEAHNFLLQVTPLIRAVAALLRCWDQLESDNAALSLCSFARAAAVQVLHAAAQLLQVASSKVARALCPGAFTASAFGADEGAQGGVFADKSTHIKQGELHSGVNSCGLDSNNNKQHESSRKGGCGADMGSNDKSVATRSARFTAQQRNAAKCWICLVKPLVEAFVGHAEEWGAHGSGHRASTDSTASRSARKNGRLPDSAAAAEGSTDSCCTPTLAESEAPVGWLSSSDGCASEENTMKRRGGILRVMNKVTTTCQFNAGRSIARSLSLYAVETGWTSLTTCCCSQCLPALTEEDARNRCSGSSQLVTGAIDGTRLRRSRWQGLLPATSESFAGSEVVNRFAALFDIQEYCNMSAVHRFTGPQNSGSAPPQFSNAPPTPSSSMKSCSLSGCCIGAEPSAGSGDSGSGSSSRTRGIYEVSGAATRHRAADRTSSNRRSLGKGICVDGRNSNDARTVKLASDPALWAPQDVELFLSEVAFLHTALSWIGSSLHVLHHSAANSSAQRPGDSTGEDLSASGGGPGRFGGFRTQAKKSREHARSSRVSRKNSVQCKDSSSEIDESVDRSEPSRLRSAILKERAAGSHCCDRFPPRLREKLAAASAELACALRGALQCLFRELRWPQQSLLGSAAAQTTAEAFASRASRTAPEDFSQQPLQQREHQHGKNQAQQQQLCQLSSSSQHRATATSGPLLLFEPLGELMIASLLLLRACEHPYTDEWTPVDELQCVVAACSAAATAPALLRALLLMYHSVVTSSPNEVTTRRRSWWRDQESSTQNGELVDSGSDVVPSQAAWLKGAAQWFCLCCDIAPLCQQSADKLSAVSAAKLTWCEKSIYQLLMQATAGAQNGGLLKRQQQMDGPARTTRKMWHSVVCASEALPVLITNIEKQQQRRVISRQDKTKLKATTVIHQPRLTLLTQQLAVCPIDALAGGSIWQCFCCDAALDSYEQITRLGTGAQLEEVGEELCLCRLLLGTPNVAEELLRYLPPGAIFAALVAVYAEPQLTCTTCNGNSSSVLRPRTIVSAAERDTGSIFSIYARPAIYYVFCKLLDTLLLQPLGRYLRACAMEQRLAQQKHAGRQILKVQKHGKQQVQEQRDGRQLKCRKGDQKPSQDAYQQQEEKHEFKAQRQKLARLHLSNGLLPSAALPYRDLYFSRAFLSILNRACQANEDEPVKPPVDVARMQVPPIALLPPLDRLHWFPVCCNKAGDVLNDFTARLLLTFETAADAADPLLSLLLWLLSSPAFPFECRRMLLRGDQTWLRVASNLFCVAQVVDECGALRSLPQLTCSRALQSQQLQHREQETWSRENGHHGVQQQNLVELASHRQDRRRREADQRRQPSRERCQRDTSFLRRRMCWGMQSPRGDVFWFTAPDSLYVVLPGLWREGNEDILSGWSLYMQDRLARGSLLQSWRSTVKEEQQATADPSPQGNENPPQITACFGVLFPLHALALLTADALGCLVATLRPSQAIVKAYESTAEQAQPQPQMPGRQQTFIQRRACFSQNKRHSCCRRGHSTPVSEANNDSFADGPQGKSLLRQELPRRSCRGVAVLECSVAERVKHTKVRYSRVKRLLGARIASGPDSDGDALVAEAAEHLARLILEPQEGGV